MPPTEPTALELAAMNLETSRRLPRGDTTARVDCLTTAITHLIADNQRLQADFIHLRDGGS